MFVSLEFLIRRFESANELHWNGPRHISQPSVSKDLSRVDSRTKQNVAENPLFKQKKEVSYVLTS